MAVSISAAPEGVAGTSAPTSLVSPQHAPKRRKMMPPLTAFQAIKAAHALPAALLLHRCGFVDDGTRLADDLYLPTICWDQYAQDKCYQPKWKIAESSRLVFPPVVRHWVERAYPPPAESAYVEGLDNENLMNATMVDAASQPRRLVEIRRRWMDDNNELHQVRITIQELMDEKYRLESQLQAAAGLRESQFVFEKNKAEGDLKRITAILVEERVMWARDVAEKDRVLSHAKTV
ncbi:hypothetical protein HanPSC8_Chr13g0558081 [Helianthus annuus]|nr:hypothetical protein HanPSC8_Chr13g0558081 [Helianthus annuus]